MTNTQTYKELQDFRCDKCDSGWIREKRGDCTVVVACDCMQKRVNLFNIKKSGLALVIDRMTFATFQAKEDWQIKLLSQTRAYSEKLLEGCADWLMICGQIGSGKTHIATAIMGDALFSGFAAKYVLWRETAMNLKRSALDEDYIQKLDELISPNILYIDDFFKGNITDADKNVAYDIINGRYMQNRPTIITCEKTLSQIMEIDEAIGSRILQMTNGNYFEISQDLKKNKRLTEVEE